MKAFFKEIVSSFYSRPFYAGLAHDQKGIGMRFVALLSFVMLLSQAGHFWQAYPMMRAGLAKIPVMAETLPAATFKDGKLSIDKPVPYEIKPGKETDAMIVIDTGYKITDIENLKKTMQQKKMAVLVTQNSVIFLKNGDRDLDIRDFKTMQPFMLTHDDWHLIGQKVESWGVTALTVFLPVMVALMTLLFNFIATFFSAVFVVVLNLIIRAGLEFDAAMRLAAAARFPATVIALLPVVFGLCDDLGGISWLIWGGYMLFATAAGKRKPPLTL